MVKHIVMWRFKDETRSPETVARMRELLEGLVGVVPELLSLEFYAGDHTVGPAAADACIVTEFPSRAALAAYDVHPEHQKARAFISGVVASRMVCDIDL